METISMKFSSKEPDREKGEVFPGKGNKWKNPRGSSGRYSQYGVFLFVCLFSVLQFDRKGEKRKNHSSFLLLFT